MTRVSKLHKWLGVFLLLPLLAWCITGMVFLFKPSYGEAYTQLTPRYYPLQGFQVTELRSSWEEFRLARTVLGWHLIARDEAGWQQYDPESLRPRAAPAPADVIRLLEDAITVNPDRYGHQVVVESGQYRTDTGVRLSLEWNTLALQQHGRDRSLIDTLYNIHYLRWTGNRNLDDVFGAVSLTCLVLTTLLGIRLLVRPR